VPSLGEHVRVLGDEAELVVWSPDYDGNGKALVHFPDGREATREVVHHNGAVGMVAIADNGDARNAIPLYLQALEMRPTYAECMHNLANAYVMVQDYDRAIGTYRKLSELHPDHAALRRARAGRRRCWRRGR